MAELTAYSFKLRKNVVIRDPKLVMLKNGRPAGARRGRRGPRHIGVPHSERGRGRQAASVGDRRRELGQGRFHEFGDCILQAAKA